MLNTKEKKEMHKYLLRFGPPILIVFLLLYFTQSEKTIIRLCYKLSMILLSVAVCEFLWIPFKMVFGRIEVMPYGYMQAVLLFRGLFYAAIILSMCLGL